MEIHGCRTEIVRRSESSEVSLSLFVMQVIESWEKQISADCLWVLDVIEN